MRSRQNVRRDPSSLNRVPPDAAGGLGRPSLIGALVDFCWVLFKWGLLVGVLGAVAAVLYFYRHVDEQICHHVQRKLAACYPELAVTARSAKLIEGEGIVVRDVSIAQAGADGPDAELLHVGELLLACHGNLEELITGQPEISRVVIRRPTLRCTRRVDGSWTTAGLLPLPKLSRHPPELVIEDGTIEIVFDSAAAGQSAGILSLGNVSLTLGRPQVSVGPGLQPGMSALKGTLSGDGFRLIRVEGTVDRERLAWSLAGSVEGLDVSSEMAEALRSCSEKLAAVGSLHGRATAQFRASGDGPTLAGCRYELAGQLTEGRLDDARLAQPLTNVQAAFRVNNQGFAIERLSAASGRSTLWMTCRGSGFGPNAPFSLEAKVRQLELDRRLVDLFPQEFRAAWQKFLPAGLVHADVKMAYDGRTWKPEVTLQCLDTSFTYYKFPYRLAHATGSVLLANDTLTADLTAQAGNRPVRIACRLSNPLGMPYGWLEAAGDNLVMDEQVYAALAEKPRAVVRSFHPEGTVNCFWRFCRDDPEAAPHRRLVVTLGGVRLRYDKFPYPMSDVRGTLEMVDDHWTCRDLVGTNDTAHVTCEGHWDGRPRQENPGELFLHLTGTDVPLEDELRDALDKPNQRKVIKDLRLEGALDLDVRIQRRPGEEKPTVAIDAEPKSEATSAVPVWFPYRMEKIQGRFHYEDGLVTIERLKAEHGETTIAVDGRCQLAADGGWLFRLENLWVDRLWADRELVGALPERLRKGVAQLKPGGPLDLHGRMAFSRDTTDAPLRSEWNLDVGFHQGSLDVGVPLENVNGQVRLAGNFDGARMQSRGELAIDSLTYKDVQFTEVMGPVWMDDNQVLLGSLEGPPVGRASRPTSSPVGYTSGPTGVGRDGRPTVREITARVFGGTAFGHARITRPATAAGDAPPNWQIRASLSQGDLRRCAQEAVRGHRDIRGKIRATVDLWGTGRDPGSLGGAGRVELHDADIYELPVMIAMLKILSIREPDLSAFSDSDFDFTVEGPHVYFSQINFNGDAISLEGRGEMNLDRAIRLTFRARLGRQKLDLPLVKELLGGASEQIMLIHVGGTLDNPVTTKEPFPTLSQALESLESDLEKTTGPEGILPRAGRWIPNPGQLLQK